MGKVLIIGQAPPAVTQSVPYDTTMLFDWFKHAGLPVTKENAHEYCMFTAVYDVFPGSNSSGHTKPSENQMNDAYERYLKKLIESHDNILVLGKVAEEFLTNLNAFRDKNVEYTMHPSKRNTSLYNKNSVKVLKQLQNIFY